LFVLHLFLDLALVTKPRIVILLADLSRLMVHHVMPGLCVCVCSLFLLYFGGHFMSQSYCHHPNSFYLRIIVFPSVSVFIPQPLSCSLRVRLVILSFVQAFISSLDLTLFDPFACFLTKEFASRFCTSAYLLLPARVPDLGINKPTLILEYHLSESWI